MRGPGLLNPFAQQLTTKWLNDKTTGGFEHLPWAKGLFPSFRSVFYKNNYTCTHNSAAFEMKPPSINMTHLIH